MLLFVEVEGTKQKVSGACPAGGVDTYDLDATSVIGGKGKSVVGDASGGGIVVEPKSSAKFLSSKIVPKNSLFELFAKPILKEDMVKTTIQMA